MKTSTLRTVASGLFTILFAGHLAASQKATVTLESREAHHGNVVRLELLLNAPSNSAPAGLQWEFRLPPGLDIVNIEPGKALKKARKTLVCSGPKCVVYGLNRTTIPNGVIAVTTIKVDQSSGGGKRSEHTRDETHGRARPREQEIQLSDVLAVSLYAKPIKVFTGEKAEPEQRQ